MAQGNAKIDDNFKPTLIAVSTADGVTPVKLEADPITGNLQVDATASLAKDNIPISGASEAVGVAIVDTSGNQITSFGGGTQYDYGDAPVNPVGTLIFFRDEGDGVVRSPGAAHPLPVDIAGGITVGAVQIEDSNGDTLHSDGASSLQSVITAKSPGGGYIPGSDTSGLVVDLGANNDVTVTGTVTATPEKASSATLANVSTSTTSATLLASNSARKKAIIVNDSTANLYVKYGTTASATSFSYLLQPYDTLEEYNYTGRIDGILASGTGTARTSEA